MFKVPEWGDDIPKSNVSFTKTASKHKNKDKIKKTKAPEVNKQNGFKNSGLKVKQNSFVKPEFKARNNIKAKSNLQFSNKFKPENNISQQSPKAPEVNGKKNKKKKQKKKVIQNTTQDETPNKSEGNIILNQYDSDKLDELILKAKKEKLNSPKNSNIEEALFTETKGKSSEKHNQTQNIQTAKKVKFNSPKNGDIEETLLTKTKENGSKKHNQNQNSSILNGKVSKSKKKKDKLKRNLEESIKNSEPEQKIASPVKSKAEHKKEIIKSLLQQTKPSQENLRNSINISKTSTLRERMLERLKAAKFRYLNERLYTSSGEDAKQLFQSDPEAFQTYHEGYQQQVKKWPVKPLDVIIQRIQKMPKSHTIADMGCGQAELSQRIPNTVRSFDLVSSSPGVEACDMAHTPLLSASVEVVVYCLALMGTGLVQYLVEANRVLKVGGHLLIAEVESRFDNVEAFTKEVQKLGFTLKKLDKTHKVFFFMEFTKVREPPVKKAKLPTLTLKPCIYKKR